MKFSFKSGQKNTKTIGRRQFLKKSSQIAISTLGGTFFLNHLLGCAGPQAIFESAEDVANIEWDANPAIPIPKDGCYFGWYHEIQNKLLRNGWSQAEDSMLEYHQEEFGKMPAVHCISDRKTNHLFPIEFYEKMADNGVFPLLRWHPYITDFKEVVDGKHDRDLSILANGAKVFGKPLLFVPFPEANIPGSHSHVHSWGGKSTKYYEKAWEYMHHIFKEEGADMNVVWGLHLLAVEDHIPFYRHNLPDNLFDWMGFTVYNLSKSEGRNLSFRQRFNQGYSWAKRKHPKKPIGIFELGSSNTLSQARWIKNTYKAIQKMPRVKLAMYAEYPSDGWNDNTTIHRKSRPAYKEAIAPSYFIGANKS